MHWTSVEKNLPPTQTSVLVYNGDVEIASEFVQGEFLNEDGEAIDNVTHWMDLPYPPPDWKAGEMPLAHRVSQLIVQRQDYVDGIERIDKLLLGYAREQLD